MNWRLIGLVGGFIAFVAVNVFFGAFVGSSFLISFVPGCIAAWFIWKKCTEKEVTEINQSLNPPTETWPVPIPVAWGTVKDVLESSKIHTRHAGTSIWKVLKEDDSRGIIQAQMSFTEQVGGMTNAQTLPRTVEVSIFLKPDGANTIVETHYQIFSPMNSQRVKEIVDDLQKDLLSAANKGKENL